MGRNILDYYVAIEKKSGHVFLSYQHDEFNPINMDVGIWNDEYSRNLLDYHIMPYWKFFNSLSRKNYKWCHLYVGGVEIEGVWILKIKSKIYRYKSKSQEE